MTLSLLKRVNSRTLTLDNQTVQLSINIELLFVVQGTRCSNGLGSRTRDSGLTDSLIYFY